LICTGTGLLKRISDKSIIEGILNQDSKTLNWLYDNYFQAVKNHVLKNSGTHDDASDVFQDSIITLYSQISNKSLNLTSDLKGYFFGIARNIWSSYLRKRKETQELDVDMVANPDENDINDLMFERVMARAFQKLKPDMQIVLNLFSEGYSYEEIAESMDLKNETYARRKKYLSKEALLDLVREDPEYQEFLRLGK
jgi:RNA polymerase sigma factor (sigma-70 family)